MENEEVLQETENLVGDANTEKEVEYSEVADEESELSKELEKAREISRNQRIRAEKAEKELKALKTQPKEKETPKNDSGYSLADIRALQDVNDEDVEEVVSFARYKNISIPEAKKSFVIQTLLKEKEEQRKTAQATNIGVGKRGSYKVSEETVLENFEKGIISDKDEDIVKLVQAQFNRKKAISKQG